MYINQFDTTGECAKRGNTAEDIFERWLIEQGREYRRATINEQYEHIDFIVKNPIAEEYVTIDVKAPKSITRGGVLSSQFLWVEFKNVQGKLGWLYGKNGYIAFYHPYFLNEAPLPYPNDRFIVVKTEDFAKLCEKLCTKGKTNSPKDALYKRYTRAGRKDEISIITMQDVYNWGQYWEIVV